MSIPGNRHDDDIALARGRHVVCSPDTMSDVGGDSRCAFAITRPDGDAQARHGQTACESASLLTGSTEDTDMQRRDIRKHARIGDLGL